MKPAHRQWLRHAVCAFLVTGCFTLPNSPAETPALWDGRASDDGYIVSVLQRGDAIFASTNGGLSRAALSDKVWHKLPLPDTAPKGGWLAREAAPSSLLVYYHRRLWFEPLKDGDSGLFVSRDLGQTWNRTAVGCDFFNVFVQSNGDLYACERARTLDPPPTTDAESAARTTDDKGQKLYLWFRVLCSRDGGKNWRDLSGGLSSACAYGFSRDLDHPELIRVAGAPEGDVKRIHHYEADDRDYVWKEIPWQEWRRDPSRQEEYVFGRVAGGSDDDSASADLSSLLKYPFLKWGNGLELNAVQIETERPAYTFGQRDPMPVALRAGFIFSREPLHFADNEDETVCWSLRGVSESSFSFSTKAKAAISTTDQEAAMAEYRADPRTRINALDGDHLYRRTIDLSKLYHFPEPGRYRVQLVKECCPFFKEDAGFTGQVIDVTITP